MPPFLTGKNDTPSSGNMYFIYLWGGGGGGGVLGGGGGGGGTLLLNYVGVFFCFVFVFVVVVVFTTEAETWNFRGTLQEIKSEN